MIIGLHHGGRTVVDLEAAIEHLLAVSEWRLAGRLEDNHPLIAGVGVERGALLVGPNAFIELLQVAGPPTPRRTVAEPGISHLSIQLPDMDGKHKQLMDLGVERHADPVDLGTGFTYMYVRDEEHNVTEIEGAAHAPRPLTPWFSHVGIATADMATMRSAYEAALGSTAIATVRSSDSPALDAVTALNEADVTMSWVPAPNARVELIQFHHPETKPAEPRPISVPGVGHLCLEVNDLEADLEAGIAAGFSLEHGPTKVDGLTVARLLDPDGNVVEYVSFDREDDPLSLNAVDSPLIYQAMDALLYSGGNP
jgi:catechol 2,3-dioxygenase-like lactoylglutathione lyase family enzyme